MTAPRRTQGRNAMFVMALLAALPLQAQEAPPADLATAVPRSLAYLSEKSVAWKDEYGCASCHHIPMMLWSSHEAKKRGYAVNDETVESLRAYILHEDDAARVVPPENPPEDRNGNLLPGAYALLALEAGPVGWENSAKVARIRDEYVKNQQSDGAWNFPSMGKHPIFEGPPASTRMVMLALLGLPDAATHPATAVALERAAAWAGQPSESRSQQVQTLQLMVDLRRGAPRESIDAQVAALLALQRPDGSWAQVPEMDGDAYATGQALYALGMAGARRSDPAVARAEAFLLRTQQPDGAWPMISRPMPGSDEAPSTNEPITSAGTAWAVLGLLAIS